MLTARWHVGVIGRPVAHVALAASDGASGRGAVIGPTEVGGHGGDPTWQFDPSAVPYTVSCDSGCGASVAPVDEPVQQHPPRQLAGVLMGDELARRFLCARCRAPALVCSHCDRGQIYCAAACAAGAPAVAA